MSGIRQQVNLYQPAKRAAAGPFSFIAAAVLVCGVLASLAAVGGLGAWRVHRLEREVGSLRRQEQRQAGAIAAAGAARSHIDPEQVRARVKALAAELAARQRAIEALRAGAAGDRRGFSARLEALARRPVEGLWIDHVALSGSTPELSLGGAALDPDLVPRYLRGLAAEPAMSGARFDSLVIERLRRTAGERFGFRAESGTAPAAHRERSS